MALTSSPTNKKMDRFNFWVCQSLQTLTLLKKSGTTSAIPLAAFKPARTKSQHPVSQERHSQSLFWSAM